MQLLKKFWKKPMKKLFLLCALLSFLFSQSAKVQFVIGNVQIQKKGESTWQRLTLKTVLNPGDKLKSAFESRAEIKTPDETIIRLKENSLLEITNIKNLADKKSSNKLFVLSGNIFAKFKKLFSGEEDNTISTPTAVAAIRGTSLEAGFDENTDESTFKLFTGKITITTEKGTHDLKPGQISDIGKDGSNTILRGSTNEDNNGFLNDKPGDQKNGEQKEKQQHFLNLYQTSSIYSNEAELGSGIEISGLSNAGAIINANGESVEVGENGFFQLLLSPQEGSFKVLVKSSLEGNVLEKTVTFRINTSSPELLLNETEAKVFSTDAVYSLGVQGNDATPNEILSLYVNGKLVKASPTPMNTQEQISLQAGDNKLSIELKDEVGHVDNKLLSVFLDPDAPEVRITSGLEDLLQQSAVGDFPPERPGKLLKSQPRNLIGFITDRQPSSGIKEAFINGEKVTLRSDGSFNFLLKFNQTLLEEAFNKLKIEGGEYPIPIKLEVTDNAGNTTVDESYQIIMRGPKN
jgi:hypothetical protein